MKTKHELHTLANKIGETEFNSLHEAELAGEELIKIDLELYNHPEATFEDALGWETLQIKGGDFYEVPYPEYE